MLSISLLGNNMLSNKKEIQEKIAMKEQNVVREPSTSEKYLPKIKLIYTQ